MHSTTAITLGVQAVTYYEMIKLVFPHVSDMIDEMCTEAMDDYGYG